MNTNAKIRRIKKAFRLMEKNSFAMATHLAMALNSTKRDFEKIAKR